jgi:hypothetical protein
MHPKAFGYYSNLSDFDLGGYYWGSEQRDG